MTDSCILRNSTQAHFEASERNEGLNKPLVMEEFGLSWW